MRLLFALFALVAFAQAGAVAASAAMPDTVEIKQGEHMLKAVVFRPEGQGPFAAVVAMHGCSGLYDRTNAVAARYREWAQQLTKDNFVVVLPDSYGSRGLGTQCRVRNRSVRTDRERVGDADAVRAWLQGQVDIRADRISLLGWSNGGISVLWTVRRRAAAKTDPHDFRSAVALYPGCGRLANIAWSARIPTLVLIGASDDWSPAQACEQMIAGAHGRSARTQIVVYPGAFHDFDHPNRTVQQRSGYAFSADGSGRIHTGTNPTARADAFKRVPQWLAR